MKPKQAGMWARQVRCLLQASEETVDGLLPFVPESAPLSFCLGQDKCTIPHCTGHTGVGAGSLSLLNPKKHNLDCTQTFIRGISTTSGEWSPLMAPRRSATLYRMPQMLAISKSFLNGNGPDLKFFLEEIGTDSREARYWLKQFQRSAEPFAVVHVERSVFEDPEMLDKLCSCLSFLYRNDMKCVLVHGSNIHQSTHVTPEGLKAEREKITAESKELVARLQENGSPAYLMWVGSNVLQAHQVEGCGLRGKVTGVNIEPLKWVMNSGHIPILQSIGETNMGQILQIDLYEATAALSQILLPLKVMLINTTGGIHDREGEIVPNINLPADLEMSYKKPWCTPTIKEKIVQILSLLNNLPSSSSLVITSAAKVLAELFTHHGSGTFFKITEPIHVHKSLKDIDRDRLMKLINRSFGKDLGSDFFGSIEDRLDAIYLSEGYNAAAIVTREEGLDVFYLDKFAVSAVKQGEGTGEMLWDCIRRDYKSLFWRSRGTNRINPWYFKKSEGSWSNGEWIVFWYGITEHRMSSALVDHALNLNSSFTASGVVEKYKLQNFFSLIICSNVMLFCSMLLLVGGWLVAGLAMPVVVKTIHSWTEEEED